LGLADGFGEAVDLGNLPASGQKRQGDDGEHRADAQAGVFAPRVGGSPQHLQQRLHLERGDGNHAAWRRDLCALAVGGQLGGFEVFAGLCSQFVQPEFFRAIVGHVKVRPVSAVTRTHAHGLPVARFVTGP
jgi:hypothetical protein